jgi:hypothetical protein
VIFDAPALVVMAESVANGAAAVKSGRRSDVRDQGSEIHAALRAGEGCKTMRLKHFRGGKAAGNFF